MFRYFDYKIFSIFVLLQFSLAHTSPAGLPQSPTVSETLDSTDCLTTNGGLGRCTELDKCYGIFDSEVGGNGNIVPRKSQENSSILKEQEDKTISEEIYNTTVSCSPPIAYRLAEQAVGLICCPVDRLIALEQNRPRTLEAESRRPPIRVTSYSEFKKQQSAQAVVDKNKNLNNLPSKYIPVATCGVQKVRLRVERRYQDGSGGGTAGTLKITGGLQTTRGEFPWMVALFGVSGRLTCGGSLINKDYVLTAAHCLESYNSKDVSALKVHIGDYNLYSEADGVHEIRRIQKIILHTGFNMNTFSDDIALMKLDRPVTFNDYIQPICLPPALNSTVTRDNAALEGRKVTVTGWGHTRSHGSLQPILRKVEVPIWRHSECQRIYKIFAPGMKVSDSQLCAGDGKRNKDACVGDSGGPLIASANSRSYQLAIVSWGKGCGSFPGVYTRVDKYLPWIMKHAQ